VPWFSRIRDKAWLYESLATQIRYHKPDVLLNHDMYLIRCDFLKEMKPYVGLLMGQHAGPPLPTDLGCYDLFISSFQPYVDRARHMGIPAELNRLGCDPAWLSCMDGEERPFDTTFIGSFHPMHASRVALLEVLCSRFPQVKVWTPRVDQLALGSSIRNCYQGVAWGREMYQILSRSKITLNHHGDVLPYANNIRLYEATAMGAMLITDWKENLPELFEPGKEVIAYRSPEECAELIHYYLGHDAERKAIAHAGQQRTLKEHTYARRMRELTEIVNRNYPRN
jgi:spore maturation protein CgeB